MEQVLNCSIYMKYPKLTDKIFCRNNYPPIFAFQNKKREFSSVGLEHLPYKQRVGGSTPSTPTQYQKWFQAIEAFFHFSYFDTFPTHLVLKHAVSTTTIRSTKNIFVP